MSHSEPPSGGYGPPPSGSYPSGQQSWPSAPQSAQASPRNGFGITALCLALAGLVLGLVPFTGFLAVILGALALLFGLLGLERVRKGAATSKKMSITGAVLGAGALALGIWGMTIVFNAFDDLSNSLRGPKVSSSAPPAAAPGEAPASAPSAGPAVAGFGSTHTWENGIEVTVGQPAPFRPSSSAAGADRARAVSFEVRVKNGSDAPFELVAMNVQASFNGQTVTQIIDSAKGVMGQPSTSVLPGKSSTFLVAFPVDKQPGEMQIEVMPGFTGDRAYFTGQV
jgi:hypothetical protein